MTIELKANLNLRALCLLAAFCLLALVCRSTNAATYTWTGAGFFGQDYLWSNDFNWAGNVAPSPGEANVTIVFPNDASPKITTNDIVGLSVASIQFQGTNYVIHGKPSGNTLALRSTSLGGWAVIASGNGNYFAGTCPLSLNSPGVVGVASGCTLSVLSSIGGTNGFLKISPGTLKFAAGSANTYTGTTTVSDGTLDLNNGTIIPSATYLAVPGPLVIGNAEPSFSPRVRLLLDNQISNNQSITVRENGDLWLNGHDDIIGSLTLFNGAEVSTGVGGGSSSPGTLTLNGSVTNVNSAGAWASIAGKLSLGSATRIFDVSSWMRIYADISGTGGFTQTGGGTLSLEGSSNTYAGTTTVQAGQLNLIGSTPGSTAAGTVIAAGAVMFLLDCAIGNESLSITGVSNTWSVLFDNTNSWAGPVSLNGPCGIRDFSHPGDPENHFTFSGAISGTGSLRKIGYGRLHFTGFGGNTFTGGLFCEEGFTFLDKSASAPALSGPLVIGRVGETGQYIFVEIMQLNQIPNDIPIKLIDYGSLSAETGAADTLGPIEFAGGLLLSSGGTITLGGDITNRVTAVPTAGIYGNVNLSGTRIIHCDEGSSLLVASALGGAGGISKYGPGELLLSGACTYSQPTAVYQGSLKLQNAGRPGIGTTTSIFSDGMLYLDGVSLVDQGFSLYGGGADNGVALVYHNTNYLGGGNVEIHSGVTFKAEPTARLTINTTITGEGGLGHIGNGTFEMAGFLANTYSGTTTFREGTLQLNHSSSAAIPHSLTVGYPTNGSPTATVKCLGPNQFAPLFGAELFSGGITLNPGSTLDCNGLNQSTANLSLTDATLTTGAGVLTMSGNLNVQPGSGGQSFLLGNLQLATGVNSSHSFNVSSNAVVFSNVNITESGTQNIFKDGTGQFGSLGALNFNGTLTIHQGRWLAANANPFGSAVGPTIVDAGASLMSFAGTFSEPLQLAGTGDAGVGALYSNSTNTFTGPITLTADATVYAESNSILSLAGAIGGVGGLVKDGGGSLKFSGTDANTFGGSTIVHRGKLELGKTGAVAIPGNLTCEGLEPSSGVRLMLANQIGDGSAVQLNGLTFFDLNDNSDTIGSLAGTGYLYLGAGTLTTGGNNASTSLLGSIHGTGGLTKTGNGTFSLLSANSYTGTTTINGGTLLVFSQQPQSPISILTGGTLGGTGRVGNISDLSGHVAPGASPGILVCSNFSTFSPANQLQIEINGTTPGDYDQVQVNGTVLLMGGMLQIAMNVPGAIGNQYVIIANDGEDAVSGTFTGLPESASVTNNGTVFQITYHGGDGNDVALIQQTVSATSQFTDVKWLGAGGVQLNATAAPNLTYSVEATTNLNSPVFWTTIGSASANGAGVLQFTDINAAQFPTRFYRLRYP